MKIYLDRVGYRDTVKDFEQITWFWEHAPQMKWAQRFQTKFWLDLLERYGSMLLKDESFELLQYLNDKVTGEQVTNRNKWRQKQKATSEAEMKKWSDWREKYKDEKILKANLNNLN